MHISPNHRATPLMIGDGFHLSLAEWYKSKRSIMAKIAKRESDKIEKEATINASYYDQEEYEKLMGFISTLPGMLIGYAKVYAKERDLWHIDRKNIESEGLIDMNDFDFHFKIDLVVDYKKSRFLVEHKTASQIPDSYIDRLPLDSQIRGYIFGATHNRGLNLKINEVIYDVVKKCKLKRKCDEELEDFTDRIAQDYIERPEFYFFREQLRFNLSDIKSFEYELRQIHAEYLWIINSVENPLDPRCWNCSDNICSEFFKTCPYQSLCTSCLDKSTAHLFKQKSLDIPVETEEEVD
jgi:hypothetical protein